MNGRMFRNLIFFKFVGNPNNRFIIFFSNTHDYIITFVEIP